MERRQLLILSTAFEGGLILLALALGWAFGHAPFATLRLDAGAAAAGLAGTLPLLAMLWIVDRTRWRIFAGLRRDIDEAVIRLFANGRIPDLALLSLLAGVGEEALFRGVIQEGLRGRLGVPAAIAAAGLLFGLAHFISASYALYAALVGAYLGLLLAATGNLLVPVIVHGLYDFLALTWLVHVRRPPGGTPGEPGPAR